MKVRAVSGYGTKGPACFLVDAGGRRFLLDLGMGPDRGIRPDLAGLGQVDAILVSHGHADHVGALDLASEVGSPPIYATAAVRALAGDAILQSGRDLPIGASSILGVDLLTGRDGHAPGGVWMRLGGAEGLLYTGDFCLESALWTFDPFPAAALVVADTSYGAYDGMLAEAVESLVTEARARALLLPAPPDGRGLEMAMVLADAGLPVRLCAAHRAVAETVLRCDPETLAAGSGARIATLLDGPRLEADAEPAGVMIAATANAAGGTARALVERFAGDPAVGIVFTGHLSEGSPAPALVAAEEATFLRWNVHPRLSDLADCLYRVHPRLVLPAFLAVEMIGALRAHLGDGLVLSNTIEA